MSLHKNSKKKVSFLVGESNLISNKNITHKTGILKAKNHKREKEEEKEEEKVQIIEEKKETKEKIEIKREEKINTKCNNPMKNMPSDEYFRLTVQDALEQGLLNIAMIHPKNPIKFLGNFLIEKSKNKTVS